LIEYHFRRKDIPGLKRSLIIDFKANTKKIIFSGIVLQVSCQLPIFHCLICFNVGDLAMFDIGLFSSHIPYIILMAVYMLYFGAYSLKKQESSEYTLTLQSESKEKQITIAAGNETRSIAYPEDTDKGNTAGIHAAGIPAGRLFCCPTILYIEDIIASAWSPCLSIFSRPPPMIYYIRFLNL